MKKSLIVLTVVVLLGVSIVSVSRSFGAGTTSGITLFNPIPASSVSAGQFGAVTGGGNYSFPTFLGIGTANPTAPLEVKAPSVSNFGIYASLSNPLSVSSAIYGSATAGTGVHGISTSGSGIVGSSVSGTGIYGLTSGSGTNAGIWGDANSGTAIRATSVTGTGIYSSSGSGVAGYFETQGPYGLIVKYGNVGIGTTNPTAKLTIASGDVFVMTQGNGIILHATDGLNCYRVTVNNAGVLSTKAVECQ